MDSKKCLFYALLAIVCCCSDVESWKIFHRGRGRVYSGVETNSLHNEDEWFDQKLDHFTTFNNATWKQRFFSNSDLYKPGGPVFLMIGGEGPANPVWMHQGNWIDLAKKFNAYLFYLEHRFYGKSHPTKNLDDSHLAYLSSEQALSDLAYFVTKMKAKLQMKKSLWIAFGGSYPGNLAAWARLKYPHLIHGSIASSAPVQAKLNFKDYLASVSISLGDKCSKAINIATKEIEKRILNNERRSLRKDLKLCDDIYSKETNDVSNLFETLAGNFEGIVQYNKGNREFEGAKGTNLTIDLICNTLTLYPGKEYEQYQKVTRIILEAYNQSCLDFKYSKMLKDMRKTSWNSSVSEGGRQWLYQTCTEFGYYQTSDNLNQPFGKNFSLDFSTKQCRDIFGKKFTDSSIKDGIKATNINYGGLSFKASRVLFVNGAIDPWHMLSFTKLMRPGKGNRVESVLIPNTSHCADMYPPNDEDTNELKEARQVILQTISRWLKKKA